MQNNSNRRVLSICIPTYNRIDKLYTTLKNILSISDSRFVVNISDNASTDGTFQKLSSIDDARLVVNCLNKKVPAYKNYNHVIQQADSDYVLLVLDKEKINENYISDFVDFLLANKPAFGLVNITAKDSEGEPSFYSRGVESVLHGGGGGNTHPSGFFYNRKLYIQEYSRIESIMQDGNLWVLDIVSAGLGTRYSSVVYNKPLITFDAMGVLGGKTMSPYTENTIYWYGGMRISTFRLFLKSIININEQQIEKEKILYELLKKNTFFVSYIQKQFFSESLRCSHYGLKTRNVSFFEMIFWVIRLNRAFRDECKGFVDIGFYRTFLALCYGGLYSAKASMKPLKSFLRLFVYGK
jgi:glycosyltransferase involved in cell wall biosynthesis